MKAKEANFLQFIQGAKQFVIPIYQRTYSWDSKQCSQLWDDIARVATDEQIPSHFIGSVVYIEEGIYQVTAVPRLLVIDGQQRLTTLSLLILALADVLEERGVDLQIGEAAISPRKLRNYYLVNNEEEGDQRYRLVLTRSDRDLLTDLIDGAPLPEDITATSSLVDDNYRFFERKLKNTEIPLENIYQGIGKLIVVDVSLHRQEDNPQLIFESLNSTGLDLSQADLIRNFILMGLEQSQQEYLYNTYWYRMEQIFGNAERAEQFDRFIRDFLTIKHNGNIPTLRDIYDEFKSHVGWRNTDIEPIVADVFYFAQYYARLAFPEVYEDDAELRKTMININTLKVDVSYPFLMEVYIDYENGRLTKEELLEIMELVESYVFRRAIVGIPTNSLNKTFATLTRSVDKERYLESLKASFMLMDSYRVFPTDEEFKQALITRDVYSLRARIQYLLDKLENYNRKEPVNVSEYTIEHIMPQNENLNTDWREALGENWRETHERWLHTLGNLTLTGYNPEYGDRPFHVKRDMDGGFRESPIRLSRGLGQLDTWNAEEIQQRGERLASMAVEVWPNPELDQMTFDSYRQTELEEQIEYTYEDYEYLEGSTRDLYDMLQRRILNLDPSVREECLKYYIAFKVSTNFVDVVPQRSGLRLTLNMAFDQIHDPEGWCRDVTHIGRWGNGNVEVRLSAPAQIDYIMFLIKQSFDLHFTE